MSGLPEDPVAASRVASDRLVAILRREIPRTTDNLWEAMATMLLARSAGVLQSVARLDPGIRTLDTGVLLRVLYDHVALFAWVAIDPGEHLERWKAADANLDLREHRAWEPHGISLLGPEALAETENLAESARGLPNVAQRAAQADRYWISRVPGIAPENHPTSASSFLALYRLVFRLGSIAAHPSVAQASHFIKDGPNAMSCHWERTPDLEREWWGIAPYVLGLGLLIANKALGWPDARDVARAVGREGIFDD